MSLIPFLAEGPRGHPVPDNTGRQGELRDFHRQKYVEGADGERH